MIYDLPTGVEVGDTEYAIRSDYRAVLDICTALSDPELTAQDKGIVALGIFYGEDIFQKLPAEHYEEALRRCFWFIDGGAAEDPAARKRPKLMDWEQDFQYIVAPVNRVIGTEIRSVEYLHWWSFLSAYYEIGDCVFAQIVRIRNLKAKGKPLDKADREWYQQNRKLVDLKTTYTEQENELLKQWGGG